MEQIKLTQTQVLSFASSAASGSSESTASTLTYIDERLIVDEM